MSPVMTAFSSLPPPPSACVCPTTPHALFLPTSHPHYGQQGPIERLQAPSGEFPLFSPLFANNPPPSPRASPPALVNTHQGKARVLFPPRTTLAASTRPCTPCFKPHQPPLAIATLRSTQCPGYTTHAKAHENAPTDGIQCQGPSMRTQHHLANNRRYSTHCAARCVPHASPLTSPKWQWKCWCPLQWGHHYVPLNHGCLDHMLTPRCTQTWLLTVRILGGYIPGSQRGAVMLLPPLEFTYNLMYSSLRNKIYNPKFYFSMERQIST